MRIMLCQTHIVWEDKKANIARGVELLQEARKQSVDLVCFPEMSFTGFSMHTAVTADDGQQGTLRQMMKLARDYQVAIAFGYVTMADDRQEGKAYNHYAVVDANGTVLADYIKLHPFSYGGEDRYFAGGDVLCDFDFMGFHIGLAICYDLRFPEQFMALGERCDFFLIGANWPAKRAMHWKTLLRARAIEQQCYVAAVNCYGHIGDMYYSGNSLMLSPDGEVIGEQEGEGYAVYEVINDVAALRDSFPVRQDRIPVGFSK